MLVDNVIVAQHESKSRTHWEPDSVSSDQCDVSVTQEVNNCLLPDFSSHNIKSSARKRSLNTYTNILDKRLPAGQVPTLKRISSHSATGEECFQLLRCAQKHHNMSYPGYPPYQQVCCINLFGGTFAMYTKTKVTFLVFCAACLAQRYD